MTTLKTLSTEPRKRAIPEYTSKSPTAVVDYESFYRTKDATGKKLPPGHPDIYSVSSMSYWHYCHDPRFDAYLVSIVTSDGLEWVGHPKDAPWEKIRNHVWVSHNKVYDESVHNALQESGIVPGWDPQHWGCSLNLAAWLRLPRALAGAIRVLYKHTMDKGVRDQMDGQRWGDMTPEFQETVKTYALEDGRWPLKMWTDHVDSWPVKERRIAEAIGDRGLFGLATDKEAMERDMDLMRKAIEKAEERIPWVAVQRANGEEVKPLSKKDCNAECRRKNIPPPASLAMTSPELAAWEDEYGDRVDFVSAMRDYRRMNGMLKKYTTLYTRIKPNGRFEFSVTYLGTHTGRTSGRDRGQEGQSKKRESANMLNMPRDPYFISHNWSVFFRKDDIKRITGVLKKTGKLPDDVMASFYLRGRIIPGKGKKFVVCDKSQIEARITQYACRNKKVLDLIRRGVSVYEAHAISMMGYVPPTNPDGSRVLNSEGKPVSLKEMDPGQYALAKARELGLGFMCGHVRFIVMAPLYVSEDEFKAIFDKPYTEEQRSAYLRYLDATSQHKLAKQFNEGDEVLRRQRIQSWIQVEDFRRKNPALAGQNGLWRSLDQDLRQKIGGTFELPIPSGRVLRYFNVRLTSDGVEAQTERGGEFKKLYGGLILENFVQAFARDVFVDDQLNLLDMDIHTVLDVYDEVITEVAMDLDKSVVEKIMSTAPDWCRTLPVGAEAEETMFYKK